MKWHKIRQWKYKRCVRMGKEDTMEKALLEKNYYFFIGWVRSSTNKYSSNKGSSFLISLFLHVRICLARWHSLHLMPRFPPTIFLLLFVWSAVCFVVYKSGASPQCGRALRGSWRNSFRLSSFIEELRRTTKHPSCLHGNPTPFGLCKQPAQESLGLWPPLSCYIQTFYCGP